MFCKNCGNQLKDDAKFCNSCGSPVEQQPQQAPQQQAPQQQAPQQFQQNYVDNQHYQYQKSGFKGKQFSTGTSGSISFGNRQGKERKGIGKLLKLVIGFGVLSVIAIVAYVMLSGPVSNVTLGTGYDEATATVIGENTSFRPNTPQIYIVFNITGSADSTLACKWYNDETSELIGEASFTVPEDVNVGYFYMDKPYMSYWDHGDYHIDILIDGEVVHTEPFTIE